MSRPEQPTPDGASRSYRLQEVLAHYPGVRDDQLRSLVKFRLNYRPIQHDAQRRIAFADLAVIRQLYKALQEGAPFKAVLRAMLGD